MRTCGLIPAASKDLRALRRQASKYVRLLCVATISANLDVARLNCLSQLSEKHAWTSLAEPLG